MMRMNLVAVIILAGASLAVGCSSKPAAPVIDSKSIVSAADWSKSETINVNLSDYSFTPADLTLQHGQPYEIHLVNGGSHEHTFSSDGFFKAAAVQRLVWMGRKLRALMART